MNLQSYYSKQVVKPIIKLLNPLMLGIDLMMHTLTENNELYKLYSDHFIFILQICIMVIGKILLFYSVISVLSTYFM